MPPNQPPGPLGNNQNPPGLPSHLQYPPERQFSPQQPPQYPQPPQQQQYPYPNQPPNQYPQSQQQPPKKPKKISPVRAIIATAVVFGPILFILMIGVISSAGSDSTATRSQDTAYSWKDILLINSGGGSGARSKISSWEVINSSKIKIRFELDNNTDKYRIQCVIKAHDGADDQIVGIPLTDAEYFELDMPSGRTEQSQTVNFARKNARDVNGIHLGCSGKYSLEIELSEIEGIITPKDSDSQAIKEATQEQLKEGINLLGNLKDTLGIKGLSMTDKFSIEIESGESDPVLTADDFYLNITNQDSKAIIVVCYVAMVSTDDSEVYHDDFTWTTDIEPGQSDTDIFILSVHQQGAKPYYNCSGFRDSTQIPSESNDGESDATNSSPESSGENNTESSHPKPSDENDEADNFEPTTSLGQLGKTIYEEYWALNRILGKYPSSCMPQNVKDDYNTRINANNILLNQQFNVRGQNIALEIDSGQAADAHAELTLKEAQHYDSLIAAVLDTLNERANDHKVRCRPVESLVSFNTDEAQAAIEVVSGDDAYELRGRFIYYKASTPDSCQYHLTGIEAIRGGVDALDQYTGNEWQDYTGPVGLSPENNHILTRNCGEMRRIE